MQPVPRIRFVQYVASLSELLSKMSMNVVYGEGCGIALGSDAFSTGKMDLSEEEINMFRAQAEELLRAAGQMI